VADRRDASHKMLGQHSTIDVRIAKQPACRAFDYGNRFDASGNLTTIFATYIVDAGFAADFSAINRLSFWQVPIIAPTVRKNSPTRLSFALARKIELHRHFSVRFFARFAIGIRDAPCCAPTTAIRPTSRAQVPANLSAGQLSNLLPEQDLWISSAKNFQNLSALAAEEGVGSLWRWLR